MATNKNEQFKADFAALLEKYNARVDADWYLFGDESECSAGYCSSFYTVIGDGVYISIGDVVDGDS